MGLRGQLRTVSERISAAWNALLFQPKASEPAPTVKEVTAPAAADCASPLHLEELERRLTRTIERHSAELAALEQRLTEKVNRRLQEELLARQQEQWRAAGDLRGFDWKVFSQNGE